MSVVPRSHPHLVDERSGKHRRDEQPAYSLHKGQRLDVWMLTKHFRQDEPTYEGGGHQRQVWDVRAAEHQGVVCGSTFCEAGLPTLQAAFSVADAFIVSFERRLLTLVRRKAAWHNDPPTPGQLRQLHRFGIPINDALTKGDASKLISQGFCDRFRVKGVART
ncbi:MAG: hypothetical protein ACRD2G_09620 [Terriglobia bacterium]